MRVASLLPGVLLSLAVFAAPQATPPVEQRLVAVQQAIQSGDMAQARQGLTALLQQAPADPRILNLLGVVEARENNFAAAEAAFQKAIRSVPQFEGAYLNLGRLYQEHTDQPQAQQKSLNTYQKLLLLQPNQLEANYQAATLLFRLGSYSPSLERLAHLPKEAQQRAPALALRCANNAGLNRMAAAESAGAQLLGAPDVSEEDIAGVIPTLVDHKAGALAAKLLDGLVQRRLASPRSLRMLASVQERRGLFKEERTALDQVVQAEGASPALLISLARAAYRSGDPEGAAGYLAHARDLEPANAAIHFSFGIICVELKLPPEAKASLSEAVRLDPNNPYYHYALAAVLLHQREADAAILHFQKYRDAFPDDPRGRFALGVAYFEADQNESAAKEFSAIAARPETRAGAELYLGRLAMRDEREADALPHFQRAIRANPNGPDAHAESALIHIHRNEFSSAQRELDDALKIEPDNHLVNLRLLLLYQRTKDSRAVAQAKRVEELQKVGEEKERLLLRSLEIRAY
ncbi:MAG: tetratricopeptide repeat protein [Bryobacteraceae bacterium]